MLVLELYSRKRFTQHEILNLQGNFAKPWCSIDSTRKAKDPILEFFTVCMVMWIAKSHDITVYCSHIICSNEWTYFRCSPQTFHLPLQYTCESKLLPGRNIFLTNQHKFFFRSHRTYKIFWTRLYILSVEWWMAQNEPSKNFFWKGTGCIQHTTEELWWVMHNFRHHFYMLHLTRSLVGHIK